MQLPVDVFHRGEFVLLLSLLCLIIYFSLFAYGILHRKTLFLFELLLPSGIFFLSFKESFVRSDFYHISHFVYFAFPAAIIYFLYAFFYGVDETGRELKSCACASTSANLFKLNLKFLLACGLIVLILHHYDILPHTFYRPTKEYTEILSMNKDTDLTSYNQTRSLLLDASPNISPQDLQVLRSSNGVDIIPHSISLLYINDLYWTPRPIIQSYSAYKSQLDKMNAEFFSSKNSPESVVFFLESIDGRYPIFDEPQTFTSLLLNYEILDNEIKNALPPYIILKRSKKMAVSNAPLKLIEERSAQVGEIIPIPKSQSSYIFAEIDWNMCLTGRLVNFFFKTAHRDNGTQFLFKLNNGSVIANRFVRDVARNGLFVSKYVGNTAQLAEIFKGYSEGDVWGIGVTGAPQFYEKNYVVKFYELSFNYLGK
ncbi:MAG: hypothetical protein LBR26_17840 [Prevotella sp.]|jgi:hypothetical protein|nr:hypothetical protein [Prevotella sp.]